MNEAIADRKLKTFVLDVANAEDKQTDGSNDHFFRLYPEFFPTKDLDVELVAPWFQRKWTTPEQVRREVPQIYYRAVIGELRDGLRAIWNAKGHEAAGWNLFNLQLRLHRTIDVRGDVWENKNLQPPPADAPIYQAIEWVRRNLRKLRVCRNLPQGSGASNTTETTEPKCAAPYFVAYRSQERFCSKSCRAESQKGHKRNWWKKNKSKAKNKETEGPITTVTGHSKQQHSLEPITRADDRRLKSFLEFLANAGEDPKSIDYVFRQYHELLPLATEKDKKKAIVEQLRDGVRAIWCAEDDYSGRWRVFTLRRTLDSVLWRQRVKHGQPSPAEGLLPKAFRYLLEKLAFLRKCANPECAAPFFIADRKRRAHCSVDCASTAQKKYKTDWWKEKGPQWRKARRRQRKKLQKRARKTG
jgi:hypothetical protein